METFLSLLVDGIKQQPYVPFLVIAAGLFTVSRCQNPIFKPLPSPNSTRLLELSAGSGALEANVRIIDLDQEQHIRYFALSYMWGSTEKPECIRFGNHTVSIGANLHSALVRMRSNFPSSVTGMRIWADAICIDQRNDETSQREKRQQILIMSKIFSKAECVVVDLGEMPEKFDAFKSIMDTVVECMASGNLRLDRTGEFRDHVQTVFPHLQNHSALGDAMTVAFELQMRPYWQRIWMVQENAVANQRRYLIGDFMVGDEIFDITINCMMRIMKKGHYLKVKNYSLSWIEYVSQNSVLSLAPRSKEGIMLIGQTRLTYNDSLHHRLSIYDLLSCLMRQEASDPRDRIYGIISMADLRAMPFDIQVDTSIPCRELSLATSNQFVQQGQLDALLALSCTVTGSNTLPSWSVDLENPRMSYSHFDSLCVWRSNFSASDSEWHEAAKVLFDKTLQIPGCMVDMVDRLCDRYPSSPTVSPMLSGIDYPKDISLWFQRSQDWTRSMLPDMEDDALLEIYYNCLVAGLSHNGDQSAFWPSDASTANRTRADRESLTLLCDWLETLNFFCTVMDDSSNDEVDGSQDLLSTGISPSDTVEVIQELVRDDDKVGQLLDELWTNPCVTTPLLSPIKFGRLGVTREHRLGLFPNSVEPDDVICIFAGVSVPFVIRQSGEAYKVVGHCYVHGLMDGELPMSRQEFSRIDII